MKIPKAVPIGIADLTHPDVKMYFENTFIRIKKGLYGDFVWAHFGEIVTAAPVQVRFTTEEEKQIWPVKDLSFDFTWPESGYYNCPEGAIKFGRRMRRQYKKAVCPENSVVYPLIGKYTGLGIFPQEVAMKCKFNWSVKPLAQVFNCQYPQFGKAFFEVKDNRAFTRAINKEIALGIGMTDSNPTVWFRDLAVGRAISPKEIKISNPDFGQEIADSLRDTNNPGIIVSLD